MLFDIADDKEGLIVEPGPGLPTNTNANNTNGEASPVQGSKKGLLSHGKDA